LWSFFTDIKIVENKTVTTNTITFATAGGT
jgi:hypothetical protein